MDYYDFRKIAFILSQGNNILDFQRKNIISDVKFNEINLIKANMNRKRKFD